jgi:hypothetical protein
MTVSGDLEKAAERVRDCGNYLIFARGERNGYIKVMVTARTADFKFLKFKGAAEKIAPTASRSGNAKVKAILAGDLVMLEVGSVLTIRVDETLSIVIDRAP